MLIINIDRTIESLLNKYLARCAKVLEDKRKSLAKKKSVKQEELDEYNASLASYEFLAKIAKNPKMYLYSGKDIIYTNLKTGESVYKKLQNVLTNEFDNGTHLIMRLSEAIAHHVSNPFTDKKTAWEYYKGNNDIEAEQVLKINKVASLLGANDFAKSLKDILPPKAFVPREAKMK